MLLSGKYTKIRRPKMVIAIIPFDYNINELIVHIHDNHKLKAMVCTHYSLLSDKLHEYFEKLYLLTPFLF